MEDYFRKLETIFSGGERTGGFEGLGSFGAFLAVFSIMVGYFAAVVINFGDFARFVKNEDEMRKGNLWGLVGNVILFSFITLMITGGTIAIFGEYVASPTEMVAKVDNSRFNNYCCICILCCNSWYKYGCKLYTSCV